MGGGHSETLIFIMALGMEWPLVLVEPISGLEEKTPEIPKKRESLTPHQPRARDGSSQRNRNGKTGTRSDLLQGKPHEYHDLVNVFSEKGSDKLPPQ